MRRASFYTLLATIGLSLVLGACGTVPESRDDVLDPRLGGPCERLIVSWSGDASRLRALMGREVEPTTADGVGELQLNVLHCRSGKGRLAPLSFAFLSVPILADSAPLVITQMPDDGWAWLPTMIVNAESAKVFTSMGYETQPAEILFEVKTPGDDILIMAQLIFASGSMTISANATGEAEGHTAKQVLVSTDPQYHSVFFGSETADRHPSVPVDLDVRDTPPLKAIDFDMPPKGAVFDRGLRFERVYWRLPRARP